MWGHGWRLQGLTTKMCQCLVELNEGNMRTSSSSVGMRCRVHAARQHSNPWWFGTGVLTGIYSHAHISAAASQTRGATKGLRRTRRLQSLVASGDLFKDASSYLCIVVGLVVYMWCEWGVRVCGVGVRLYTSRCYSCIQMRGVKKWRKYNKKIRLNSPS
jgi:hypothetical protein